jgi:hypothetical protein
MIAVLLYCVLFPVRPYQALTWNCTARPKVHGPRNWPPGAQAMVVTIEVWVAGHRFSARLPGPSAMLYWKRPAGRKSPQVSVPCEFGLADLAPPATGV